LKVTSKNGKIRLIDGSATPVYLEIDFDTGEFNGPMGVPKVEEILVLDRGNITADFHYIEGSDDKVMTPVTITFSAFVVDKAQCKYLLEILRESNNGNSASPPVSTNQVHLNSITSTKQDTKRDGTNFNPPFVDGTKIALNVDFKMDMSTDVIFHYNEVWFPLDEQMFVEGEDGTRINLTGYVYGTITTDATFGGTTNIET